MSDEVKKEVPVEKWFDIYKCHYCLQPIASKYHLTRCPLSTPSNIIRINFMSSL